MTPRMKILASAYACRPDGSAEDRNGWNWVTELSQIHEVWAFVNADSRPSIEAHLQHQPFPDVHWVFYDIPRWMRLITNREPGGRMHYAVWQWGAYQFARKLHYTVKFDLVHHITFVQYWTPSYMVLLPIPFVWGPVGGGETAPKSFYRTFGNFGRRYELIRDIGREIGHLHPIVRLDARKAKIIYATSEQTALNLKNLGAQHIHIMQHYRLIDEEVAQLIRVDPKIGGPFRILSIGRLFHWKGFYLGVQAVGKLLKTNPDIEYWIAGDGFDRERIKKIIANLGIAQNIRWLGYVPRQEAFQLLGQCDVLLHPSLHDSGGTVIVEAMAAGRCVVCFDLGGPAVLVPSGTGFKVPAIDPEQAIDNLASALTQLANNPALLRQMGTAARDHVLREYSWAESRQMLERIYDEL